jgi:hypothetical protein
MAMGDVMVVYQAHLWADSQGRLFTGEAGSCSSSQGQGGGQGGGLTAGKWQLVSLVVDCVAGELEVFLDGTCLHVKGSCCCFCFCCFDDVFEIVCVEMHI